MRRREVITLVGGATVWPLAALAQQAERKRRIGVLMGYAESDPDAQGKLAAFREGLQKLGWAEDRNIRMGTRWPIPADTESMQRLAKELVALQPDLILSHITPTTAALLQQTRTIPIIFAAVSDPVGSGFVASFRQPGGNVTGFTSIEPTLPGKWLELLKEIAPHVTRVAVLFNPVSAPYVGDFFLGSLKAALCPPEWRWSQLLFVTRLSLNPWSLHKPASRIADLSGCRIPSWTFIARTSHRWRRATVSLRSIRSANSLTLVACYPTEMISRIIFGVLRSMPIASCEAQSRASFRSRRRSSSS